MFISFEYSFHFQEEPTTAKPIPPAPRHVSHVPKGDIVPRGPLTLATTVPQGSIALEAKPLGFRMPVQ